jgi:F-type H+-transporting ATPase subunit delta
VIISGVARRYARAIFEIGLEEENYKTIFDELEDFLRTLQENPEAKEVIDSSVYNVQEKRRVLEAVLGEKNYLDRTRRFLQLVFEKKRMPFIGQIIDGLKALIEKHEGIERVEVTVPKSLGDDQREEIVKTLSERIGKKIVLEEKVEPSIIGGLIIKAGSTVYDGSVKNQIHKLGENLKKGR